MNKSTFRDDLSGYIRGHVAKSIAPFQLRISIHRIIENMILGKIALPIYTIMSCSRLFVNSFLTDW